MRLPQDSAVSRRDDQLARTRRLTIRIAGGATAASIGLAGALGFALPGKTSSTASQTARGATPGTTSGTAQHGGTGTSGPAGRHHHAGHLAPPARHPATTHKPPVVSSGGS